MSDSPQTPTTPAPERRESPTPATFHENDEVGPYRLVRYIHRGAFGEVWMGRHAITGSYCAVKLVRDGEKAAIEVSGVRTYMTLAMRHPGLVTVTEFNYVPGTGYYYTMPLADDVNGRTVVRSATEYEPLTLHRYRDIHKPLPIGRVLAVLRNLLPSLQALHEAGLVHRDIKPANVISVDGVWKLCDVGLLVRRDQAGLGCGTPWFMPPEGNMDRRADLYALGRMLFLLVTDNPPGEIDGFLAGRSHVPGADSRRDALREVIGRACRKEPAERYQSAAEMLTAIRPLVRVVRFTLVLNEDYEAFTPHRRLQLIAACRCEGFDIGDDPAVEAGSVRITFELLPEEAQRFEARVRAGALEQWKVVGSEWEELAVPEESPEPSGTLRASVTKPDKSKKEKRFKRVFSTLSRIISALEQLANPKQTPSLFSPDEQELQDKLREQTEGIQRLLEGAHKIHRQLSAEQTAVERVIAEQESNLVPLRDFERMTAEMRDQSDATETRLKRQAEQLTAERDHLRAELDRLAGQVTVTDLGLDDLLSESDHHSDENLVGAVSAALELIKGAKLSEPEAFEAERAVQRIRIEVESTDQDVHRPARVRRWIGFLADICKPAADTLSAAKVVAAVLGG